MRVGTLNDLEGRQVGTITEQDDGQLVGEGVGKRLLEQAPLKSFDDWVSTLHHSTYLRMIETPPEEAAG